MLAPSLIAYPLLMAALALLVRAVRPDWRTIKIVVLTNMPLPLCAMAATGLGIAGKHLCYFCLLLDVRERMLTAERRTLTICAAPESVRRHIAADERVAPIPSPLPPAAENIRPGTAKPAGRW